MYPHFILFPVLFSTFDEVVRRGQLDLPEQGHRRGKYVQFSEGHLQHH
jgi:hypothetical protein